MLEILFFFPHKALGFVLALREPEEIWQKTVNIFMGSTAHIFV